MKEMVVISGKGGTGKTVITANFAVLAQNKVIADCDVDAADLHLLTKPNIEERHEFKSSRVARIESELCKKCGKCHFYGLRYHLWHARWCVYHVRYHCK